MPKLFPEEFRRDVLLDDDAVGAGQTARTPSRRSFAQRLGGGSQAFSHVGDETDGCDARQKQVRSGFGRNEA